MSDTPIDSSKRTWIITSACAGAVGGVATAVPFVSTFQPSEKAKAAGAAVEADISALKPGEKMVYSNNGFIVAGLMAEHAIDPEPYLADVHDIDFSVLTPDPALAARIRALPRLRALQHRRVQVGDGQTRVRHQLRRSGCRYSAVCHC